MGSAAKSSSRRCFTFDKVTTPTAPRTPLPTKFAVAEKHMAHLLPCEDCTYSSQSTISRGNHQTHEDIHRHFSRRLRARRSRVLLRCWNIDAVGGDELRVRHFGAKLDA